jgi:hypothetical protein
MAMVLVVIGLVLVTVYPALNAVRVSTQNNLTQSNLQALLRATAVYVQANGCIPCPTPATAIGDNFGRVRGDTSAAACGPCAQAEGIPPFVSLGLPMSMAHDGWGRWITMRVDPALTGGSSFTPVTPLTGVNQTQGLCSAGLNKNNAVLVQIQGGGAQPAAVIFLSHGANGCGAFQASALSGSLTGSRLCFSRSVKPNCAESDEHCNADDNREFVNASPAPFDDVLLFTDRNNLVSWLGNGSCQTPW